MKGRTKLERARFHCGSTRFRISISSSRLRNDFLISLDPGELGHNPARRRDALVRNSQRPLQKGICPRAPTSHRADVRTRASCPPQAACGREFPGACRHDGYAGCAPIEKSSRISAAASHLSLATPFAGARSAGSQRVTRHGKRYRKVTHSAARRRRPPDCSHRYILPGAVKGESLAMATKPIAQDGTLAGEPAFLLA